MKRVNFKRPIRVARQRGVVLIVALIMVLLMTIVAVTSIRGSGLQESMAGNMRDRNLAFQSCEAGLREGETLVTVSAAARPTFDGTKGMFKDLNITPATSVNYFALADWNTNGQVVSFTFPGLSSQSRYVAESIKTDPTASAAQTGGAIDQAGRMESARDFYRVSCIGFGMSTDSQVVAQSIAASPAY